MQARHALSAPAAAPVQVLVIQVMCFKEIIAIGHVLSKEKKLPWFRVLNWYFLIAANYFFYGESLFGKVANVVHHPFASRLYTHHSFISFSLYMLGRTARAGRAAPFTVLCGPR